MHRTIGAVEDPAALFGEDVIDEPPVGDDVPALDETTGNEAVDHCGDRRRTHGQPLGQVGRDGRSLVEEAEHAVLGEREIDGPEADLDLLAEPGGGPPEGPAPGLGGTRVVDGGVPSRPSAVAFYAAAAETASAAWAAVFSSVCSVGT